MAEDVESTEQASDVKPTGLLTDGTTRIAAVVIAVIALAGISAGAWLRWHRS